VDAVLQVEAAENLVEAGRSSDAVGLAARVVEELPGNEYLMAWERKILAGEETLIDLAVLLFGESAWDGSEGEEDKTAD
jgi:hypothetical protein